MEDDNTPATKKDIKDVLAILQDFITLCNDEFRLVRQEVKEQSEKLDKQEVKFDRFERKFDVGYYRTNQRLGKVEDDVLLLKRVAAR